MPHKEILFIDTSGNVQSTSAEVLLRKLNVGSIIRIPQSEFPSIAQPGQKLWHINLPIRDGSLGEWVLLAEIIEHGYKQNGDEQSPLLSFAHALLAKTVSYLNKTSQHTFQDEWADSTIGLTSRSQIPDVLYNRYNPVRGISYKEAQTTPIAIRRFKIRKLVGDAVLNTVTQKSVP